MNATENGNRAALSGVTASFEEAWRGIHRFHPALPTDTTIIVASRGRRLLNGYHQPQKWALRDGEKVNEVLIAAEGLSRGAPALMATLLHEAAHALNWARGVKDTSQSGRYHNERFAIAAREVGLEPTMGDHGWDTEDMKPDTAIRYAEPINRIREAVASYRFSEPLATPGADKNNPKAVCQCLTDNMVRASRRRLKKGLVCPECGTYFAEVPEVVNR